MAIRPAFAALRTIFAVVEYLVQPWRFRLPATQTPFFKCPATPRWSSSVTDPRPEILKTNLPCESFGFDTLATADFAVGALAVPAPGGAEAVPGGVPDSAGGGVAVDSAGAGAGTGGAGRTIPGPLWPTRNAYIAAVSSGPE